MFSLRSFLVSLFLLSLPVFAMDIIELGNLKIGSASPMGMESKIAFYVGKQCPDWILEKIKQPSVEEGARVVSIQRVVGGQVVIGVVQQKLVRGSGYSYPSKQVQGLTKVSRCPLLFGSMAPDQYILPKSSKIPEFYLKRILELYDFQDEKTKIIMREKLSALELKEHGRAYDSVISSLESIPVKISKDTNWAIAQILQAYFGNEYMQAIVQSATKSRYAAITISERRLTETSGFDLPLNLDKIPTSEKSPYHVNYENGTIPRVIVYKDDKNPYLTEHMVIQSSRDLDKEQKFRSRLTIDGNDFKYIVNIYLSSIAANIPLIINCQDGIDRTGIMMVAIALLHNHYQNPTKSFTLQSEAYQREYIIALIESMRMDRGPFFLRSENDIVRAVLLGYSLIATQKLQEAEIHNQDESVLAALRENQKNISQQFTTYNFEDPSLFDEMIRAKSVDKQKPQALYTLKNVPAPIKDQFNQIGFDLDLDIYKKSPKKHFKRLSGDLINDSSGKPKKEGFRRSTSLPEENKDASRFFELSSPIDSFEPYSVFAKDKKSFKQRKRKSTSLLSPSKFGPSSFSSAPLLSTISEADNFATAQMNFRDKSSNSSPLMFDNNNGEETNSLEIQDIPLSKIKEVKKKNAMK